VNKDFPNMLLIVLSYKEVQKSTAAGYAMVPGIF